MAKYTLKDFDIFGDKLIIYDLNGEELAENVGDWIAITYFTDIASAAYFYTMLDEKLDWIIIYDNRSDIITIGLKYGMELYVGKK